MTSDEIWAVMQAAYERGFNDALDPNIIECCDLGWNAYRDEILRERKMAFDSILAFLWGAPPAHPVVVVDAQSHTYQVTLPGGKVVVLRDVSKFADELVPWR